MSDYALNKQFRRQVGESMPKDFERMRRLGVVPGDPGPSSLISRVDRFDSCRGTAAVFRSRLWRLLTHPHLPYRELKNLIHMQAMLLGVERVGTREPRGRLQQAAERQEGLDLLVGRNSLDAVALLGALYKEALWFGELEIALALRAAYVSSVVSYAEGILRHASDRHIAPFAAALRRDLHEWQDTAFNRVIFSGREDAVAGEYAEVQYAFALSPPRSALATAEL